MNYWLMAFLMLLLSATLGALPVDKLIGEENTDQLNVSRKLFFLEAFKGLLAIIWVHPLFWEWISTGEEMDFLHGFRLEFAWLGLFFIVLAQSFSPFRWFEQRSAFSVAVGAALALSPVAALFAIMTYLVARYSQRKSSESALFSLVVFVLVHFALASMSLHIWGLVASVLVLIFPYKKELDEVLGLQSS